MPSAPGQCSRGDSSGRRRLKRHAGGRRGDAASSISGLWVVCENGAEDRCALPEAVHQCRGCLERGGWVGFAGNDASADIQSWEL